MGSARRGARMRGALGANEKKHFCRRYFGLILSFFYIVGLEKQTLDAKGPKTVAVLLVFFVTCEARNNTEKISMTQ